MSRYASEPTGGDFKPAPEGTHIARCFSILDLGTRDSEYMGVTKKQNQIVIRFELPFELLEGSMKPMIADAWYTNSLHEKAKLRQALQNWRGRAFTQEELRRFDLNTIIGKACTISVVHNDKGRAKVDSVAGLPKGTAIPEQFNPSSSFWIDEFDQDVFDALPKFFQDKIMESDEYRARLPAGQRAAKDAAKDNGFDDDQDIPF